MYAFPGLLTVVGNPGARIQTPNRLLTLVIDEVACQCTIVLADTFHTTH